MLATTSAFDTAIKANARKINARVKINYTDAFLDPTITAEPIGTDIITDNVPIPKVETHTLTNKVTIDCIVRPDFAYDTSSNIAIAKYFISGSQSLVIGYASGSDNFYVGWNDGGSTVYLFGQRFDDGTTYTNLNQRIRITYTLNLSSGGQNNSTLQVKPLESGTVFSDISWSGTPSVLSSYFSNLYIGQQQSGLELWDGNIEYLNIYDNQLLTSSDIDDPSISKTISYSGEELLISEDDQALKTEGNNRASYPDQVVNGRPETTHKWFSLELDSDGVTPINKLDGTFHPMPGTEQLATFNEVGWWGDVVSYPEAVVHPDTAVHTLTNKVTIDCIVEPTFAYDTGSINAIYALYLSNTQRMNMYYDNSGDNLVIRWVDDGSVRYLYSQQFDDGTTYTDINQRLRITATLDLSSGGTNDSTFRIEPLEAGSVFSDTSWSGTPDILSSTISNLYKGQYQDSSNQWQGTIEYLNIYDNQLLTSVDIDTGNYNPSFQASPPVLPGDQGILVEFSARQVTSFQITGDDIKDEYPVDFTVEFYAGAVLEGTETITGNTLVNYSQDITALDDITSIELHITKWSDPYKVAKITEFVTSVFETYTASEIDNFNITEQREISNDNSVPTGNIASNECDLSIMNTDRRFDAGNTASPIFGLIKPNNKVDIEIGVLTSSGGFEYVPVFTGWTGGWNVPDSDIIANVSARDRLEVLRKSYITTSNVIVGDTFSDWFTTVFQDAGLAVTEYEIDSVLDGSIYVVPYGWFNDVSHRDALEILSTSCSASVSVDRNGIIQVKSVDYFETNNLDSILTYDRSEYMDKSNQPIYENIVNKIAVTTQPLEKTTGQTVYQTLSSDKETITSNSVTTYEITYKEKPVSDAVASIDPVVSGVTVTDSNLYAWGGSVEVTNTNASSQEFQIKVVGSTYEVEGQKTITAFDQDSIDNSGTFFLNYEGNDFLQDTNLAGKIANTLLKSFKDPQRDLTVNFSPGGNPALENDDRIAITDLYSTKEYNIISQRINYDGGLNIEQKGRVIGNVFILFTETGDNLITENDLFIVLE